jgi:type I restriction enzyme S subunit
MPIYCYLKERDILLSLTGNVGRCCIVDQPDLLLNQRVAKIHPKLEKNRPFSYFFFRLYDTRKNLEEMAKGTAQANLSPIETSNIKIEIPPREVMDNFSMISTPIFEKIVQNKKAIRTLEKLRDTLLPKLMSGEVRVEV